MLALLVILYIVVMVGTFIQVSKICTVTDKMTSREDRRQKLKWHIKERRNNTERRS